MKKTLNTDAITNELRIGSAFFNQSNQPQEVEAPAVPPSQNEQVSQSPPSMQERLENSSPTESLTSNQETILTSKQVSNEENKQESLQASQDESMEDRILLEVAAAPIKPNTFRFSQLELDFVRDAVYDAEVKYKTQLDKNDVVRIALEWLMNDYQQKGEASFLVSILTRKKVRK